MNQAELIDAIANDSGNTGISKTAIKFVLETQAKVAHAALAKGDEVTLPGIGKITVKDKPARVGRNPRTGEPVNIPAKKAAHFGAAKALKDALA